MMSQTCVGAERAWLFYYDCSSGSSRIYVGMLPSSRVSSRRASAAIVTPKRTTIGQGNGDIDEDDQAFVTR